MDTKNNLDALEDKNAILNLAVSLTSSLHVEDICLQLIRFVSQYLSTTYTAVLLDNHIYFPKDSLITTLDDEIVKQLLEINQMYIASAHDKNNSWEGVFPHFGQSVLLMPLSDESPTGVLITGTEESEGFAVNQLDTLQAFLELANVAIANAFTYQDELNNARLQERRALVRLLHSTAGQTIYAANTMAELLPRISEKNPQKMQTYMDELAMLTKAAMADIRTLMLELQPEAIPQTELNLLIKQLCDSFTGQTRISVTYKGTDKLFLPPEIQIACYQIIKELLANIAKHAEATAVSVQIIRQKNMVEFVVKDNGRGFDSNNSEEEFADFMGLRAIQTYAKQIGAVCKIDSHHNEGKTVLVTVEVEGNI